MPTVALLTAMDQPLAPCAGNAIEVRCAIEALTGRAPAGRLMDVTMALAVELLVLAGLAADAAGARDRLDRALASGQAAERFARMVSALGGPTDLLERADERLPLAACRRVVHAPSDGIIEAYDVRALGMAVVMLGGGRRRAEDRIDPAVGIVDFAPLGRHVRAGDALAVVLAREGDAADAASDAIVRGTFIREAVSGAGHGVGPLVHARVA